MKLFIIVLKILAVGALLIISNGNLALSTEGNIDIFFHEYYLWLSELFNQGVAVTGYIVGIEWLPNPEID